jgi:hypothetical protein
VLLAAVATDSVVLYLTAGADTPPAPWTLHEPGRSWLVRAADVDAGPAPGPDVPAPYPALANIAASDGYEILVDLEAAPGLVALGGDPDRAREVATSLAVELATNGWSDGVRVTLVGFGDDLEPLAPSSIRQVDRLDAVLPQVEQELAGHRALLASLGVDGVLSGRAARGARPWLPQVVVLSGPPTEEEATRLQAALGAGRTPLAVVCVGDTAAARWRFTVTPDGSVELGMLGVTGAARRLPREEYREVIDLLTGADRRRGSLDRDVAALSPQLAASATLPHDPGQHDQGQEAPAAQQERHPGHPARSSTTVSSQQPAAVEIRLLGPIRVEPIDSGHQVDPIKQPLLTEVVVAAALHRDGLHDAALRSAIWPRGVGDDVVDRTMAEAANWLGSDPAGIPRLHRGPDGRWQLTPDVRTDWDTFRTLAAGAGGPQEYHQLWQGLALGTGEVFSDLLPGRFGWLDFHRAARDARVLTTTVTRRLASLAIAAGRRQQAWQVLNHGLAMVPTSEPLWRDLLRLVGDDDPSAIAATARQMYGVLLVHGVRLPEAQTDALVDALAPGLREQIA